MKNKLNIMRDKTELLAIFFRQFYALVKAGLPVYRSLDILAESVDDVEFKKVLTDIVSSISQKGVRLNLAFQKHPSYFTPIHTYMIKVGEESGSLAMILEQLAIYQEKQLNFRRKVIASLTYPAVVVVISVIVMYALAKFILPIIIATVSGFAGKNLPWQTELIFKAARIADSPITLFFTVLFLAAAIIILINYIKTPVGKLKWDTFKIKTPVMGKFLVKVFIARFFLTLYALYKAGIPLLNALEIAAKAGNNDYIYRKISNVVIESIKGGKSVYKAFDSINIFPNLMICFMQAGEESGEMAQMFKKIIDVYEIELELAAEQVASLIEPIIICMLGGIACIIAMAAFIPIYQIMQGFG